MTVTEFAILRVPETNLPFSARLLDGLAKAKADMETYSGHKFFYYRCLEDPAVIYIIGCWPSVEFHLEQWIPSQENQDLLKDLQGLLTVDAMFHLDIDQQTTPIPTAAAEISIARHYVKSGKRAEFRDTFERGRRELEVFVGKDQMVVGGFRIDRDQSDAGEEKDEFILFTGWKGAARDDEFGETKGYARYKKIRNHVDGVDLTHARILRVSTTA